MASILLACWAARARAATEVRKRDFLFCFLAALGGFFGALPLARAVERLP